VPSDTPPALTSGLEDATGAIPASDSPEATSKRRSNRPILVALVAVIVLDIVAFLVVPPQSVTPGEDFTYPADAIRKNLEPVAPHVVIPAGHHAPAGLVVFDVSISSTILTSWIIIAVLLVVIIALARRPTLIPGRGQNAIEALYGGLYDFALGIGGHTAGRYVPLFASLFVYILFCNWSGLMPLVGKVEFLRAPTSDVNITVGLALVSFVVFHLEGVRALGVGGYLGKFFPLGEFRKGIGAGIMGLFVGIIEFLLEFIKPLTLAMRLFGNIYGGEVALGVVTGLLIAIVPIAIYGLEFILNVVQALIFSLLTLMFTLLAVEGHHEEEHHEPAEEAVRELADPAHDVAEAMPA
jgi:F-type H+-transporting ATPase subunit a